MYLQIDQCTYRSNDGLWEAPFFCVEERSSKFDQRSFILHQRCSVEKNVPTNWTNVLTFCTNVLPKCNNVPLWRRTFLQIGPSFFGREEN